MDRGEHAAWRGAADYPSVASPLTRVFAHAGTLVRLARHQHLHLGADTNDCSFLLHSGALALEAALPARHVVGFWHVGDLLEASHVFALPRLSLRALQDSEIWRLSQTARKPLFTELPDVLNAYQRQSARMVRRLVRATAILGRLSAEERVASFLLHEARGPQPSTRTLSLPMSRADIADHLGLNPDTLSRIMRRLQAGGIIQRQGRGHLIVRDWAALAALSPIPPDLID